MKKTHQISESELEIMRIIWSNKGSALFAHITAELDEKEKEWKTNTVLTFLSRLVEKEMLGIKKRGRLNEYISLYSESEYMAAQTKTFLDKVYRGNARNLVSSLLEQDCLTSDDFEELKKFWNGGETVK
jgi:BlaI family penicillinase repressor